MLQVYLGIRSNQSLNTYDLSLWRQIGLIHITWKCCKICDNDNVNVTFSYGEARRQIYVCTQIRDVTNLLDFFNI